MYIAACMRHERTCILFWNLDLIPYKPYNRMMPQQHQLEMSRKVPGSRFMTRLSRHRDPAKRLGAGQTGYDELKDSK